MKKRSATTLVHGILLPQPFNDKITCFLLGQSTLTVATTLAMVARLAKSSQTWPSPHRLQQTLSESMNLSLGLAFSGHTNHFCFDCLFLVRYGQKTTGSYSLSTCLALLSHLLYFFTVGFCILREWTGWGGGQWLEQRWLLAAPPPPRNHKFCFSLAERQRE